jgi:alkylation response protein AidB-like acyl-CoA dehydrogenase
VADACGDRRAAPLTCYLAGQMLAGESDPAVRVARINALALELTAEYAREREQFDRPIGSFQAVSSRLADGYIDIKGLRLTVTQAKWRLSEDLPAEVDVNTAAFWAADAGHRVAHTTVHVHGGVGVDTDHPVHRYFLAAKQTEFAVGGATGQLLRIGRELADTPA